MDDTYLGSQLCFRTLSAGHSESGGDTGRSGTGVANGRFVDGTTRLCGGLMRLAGCTFATARSRSPSSVNMRKAKMRVRTFTTRSRDSAVGREAVILSAISLDVIDQREFGLPDCSLR